MFGTAYFCFSYFFFFFFFFLLSRFFLSLLSRCPSSSVINQDMFSLLQKTVHFFVASCLCLAHDTNSKLHWE
ncbi:hypothetical protein V8E55_010195 [Tylopilus felleus]